MKNLFIVSALAFVSLFCCSNLVYGTENSQECKNIIETFRTTPSMAINIVYDVCETRDTYKKACSNAIKSYNDAVYSLAVSQHNNNMTNPDHDKGIKLSASLVEKNREAENNRKNTYDNAVDVCTKIPRLERKL
ncbi:MAG: hypothetical protein NTY22_05365 [Proteobacteria bacterium]|nr:hypothetical protein [Pseudomonadota bacterium]